MGIKIKFNPEGSTDNESPLVQLNDRAKHATRDYLNQLWPI